MRRLVVATAAGFLVLLAAAGSLAVNLAPGDLVVVDIGTRVVVRVDPISGAQTLITDAGGAFDVAVAANGTIWGSRGDHLVRVDPITGVRTLVADPLCAVHDCDAMGISIAPSGAIIVGTFGLLSPVISVHPVTGGAAVLKSTTNGLMGVAVDAAGDIFVAQEIGPLLRLDSTGALLQSYDLIGPPGQEFGRPRDIAFAPDGDLIILDWLRRVFVKLDVESGAQTILDPLIFSSFPFGMAVEPSGSLVFIAEAPVGSVALWRFDPVSQTSSLITSGGFLSLDQWADVGRHRAACRPGAPLISPTGSFLLVACLLALGTLLLNRHNRAVS